MSDILSGMLPILAARFRLTATFVVVELLATVTLLSELGLGGMTVLRYTRVFRNTDGMIFNTVKNTDAFLSISVAAHNKTERCKLILHRTLPPVDESYRHIPYTAV